MLKNKNDFRSILYMVVTTTLFILLWLYGSIVPTWAFIPVYIWFLFMSVSVAVMAHNHNHLNMWKNKWMNRLTDNWLTLFYGFPVFAWIPTHNANHHKYVNKEEDFTKTYRFTEKNNLFTVLTYPSISGFFQQQVVWGYFKEVFTRNKSKSFFYALQFVLLVAWVVFFFVLDWQKALLYVVIPQQVSLFSVLLFNYIQHVHADEETKYNSSRNWEGILNLMLFNNGLHTVHHLYPNLHWSETPAEHELIKHKIDPSLIETSFWGFLFRVYIMGLFSEKYKTKSMRVARIQKEQLKAA
jgi:beta-carotene hydroxylase